MRLNCQFDLMESGQSPDGLGRDSHHRRRPCRSLRSPCSSAVSAIVGRGSQHLESHPAPLMSRDYSARRRAGTLAFPSSARCISRALMRSSSANLGSRSFQWSATFNHHDAFASCVSYALSSKPILTSPFTARHLLAARTLEATLVKTLFEVATVSQAPFESPD